VQNFETSTPAIPRTVISPRVAAVVLTIPTAFGTTRDRMGCGWRLVCPAERPTPHPNDNAFTEHSDEFAKYNAGSINSGNDGPRTPIRSLRAQGLLAPANRCCPCSLRAQLTTGLFHASRHHRAVRADSLNHSGKMKDESPGDDPDGCSPASPPSRGLNILLLLPSAIAARQLGAAYRYFVGVSTTSGEFRKFARQAIGSS